MESEGHWFVADPLLQGGDGLALEVEGSNDWWIWILRCSV